MQDLKDTPAPAGTTRRERRSKQVAVGDLHKLIREYLPDGGSLSLGGVLDQNRPVALAKAVALSGVRGLKLFSSPVAGYDADLLIGAGCVAETFIATVTFEFDLAPCFRYFAEQGLIRAHGVDGATLVAGYLAAAEGVPFHPISAVKGTDLLKVNPLLKKMKSPFDGQDVYAVAPIQPDLVLIHAQEADIYGNVRHLSMLPFADPLIARAARRLIVSVDRIVSNDVIRSDPRGTTIPGHLVSAVVQIDGGAKPTGSAPLYGSDEQQLRAYVEAASGLRKGQKDRWQAYLEQTVLGLPAGRGEQGKGI